MLGKRSDQRGLWEADRRWRRHRRERCIWTTWARTPSGYGLLASLRGQLFRDVDFAEIYCPDNGRDSVPPRLLAAALLLQTGHDKVSGAAAKARADCDIWWKVALGIEIEDRPFAKSTLQMFRAQLILHDKVREVFEQSRRFGSAVGLPETAWDAGGAGHDLHPGTGRGEGHLDSNLLADGIVKLLRALAAVALRDHHQGMGRSPGVREVPAELQPGLQRR